MLVVEVLLVKFCGKFKNSFTEGVIRKGFFFRSWLIFFLFILNFYFDNGVGLVLFKVNILRVECECYRSLGMG